MADGEKSNATKSSKANSELNPQLQSIFTDIENNLPTINFDVSDVSIFNPPPRKRSLGQGNVFTPVCDSVHKEGGRVCLHGVGRLHPSEPEKQAVLILLKCFLVFVCKLLKSFRASTNGLYSHFHWCFCKISNFVHLLKLSICLLPYLLWVTFHWVVSN